MLVKPGDIKPFEAGSGLMSESERLTLRADIEANLKRLQEEGDIHQAEESVIGTGVLHLKEESYRKISSVTMHFAKVLVGSGFDPDHTRNYVVHNTTTNLAWHLDSIGTFRFLHNLGPPTRLEIANGWDPNYYATGIPRRDVPPSDSSTLELAAGGTYVINNLVTDESLLKLHQTPDQPGRLVLATYFYPPYNWEESTVNGGITVDLAEAA